MEGAGGGDTDGGHETEDSGGERSSRLERAGGDESGSRTGELEAAERPRTSANGCEGAMVASGMKPPAKAGGGRHAVETASPVGNDEGRAGPGNPMNPAAARIQDPKEP